MGVCVRDPWLDEKISMTKKLGLAAPFGAVPIIGGLLLLGRWFLPKTMLLFGAAILIIPVVSTSTFSPSSIGSAAIRVRKVTIGAQFF
jgi:hypothetical protein